MNGVEGEKSKNGVHFDESRIDRMITRWAGVRQAGRSRTERTELITSKTETHNLPEYKVDESGVVLGKKLICIFRINRTFVNV